jgi:hypothetical protein
VSGVASIGGADVTRSAFPAEAAGPVDQRGDALGARRPDQFDPELVGTGPEPFRPHLTPLGSVCHPDIGVLSASRLMGVEVDQAEGVPSIVIGDRVPEGADNVPVGIVGEKLAHIAASTSVYHFR